MSITVIGEEEITDFNISSIAAIDRTKMAQRVNARFCVLPTSWRVWDALQTALPGTSSADDLAIVTGTWASSAPYIGTSDLKTAGATTRYAGCFINVPHDFEANESLTLRAWAGMITHVADVSATIDFEVWRIDADGTLGAADVCATAATSINSLTAASKDFTLTPTTISAGDQLQVRMAIAVNDAASASAVIAALWQLELLADLM